MGYENEHPDIQEQKLDEKYKRILSLTREQLKDPNYKVYIEDWFNGYNAYLSSKYSISLTTISNDQS
jgi:hypothetical protein